MEDEDEEVLSVSDPSDSSEYTVDHEEEELEDASKEDEPSVARSAPFDEDRKSKNVDALLRYRLIFFF